MSSVQLQSSAIFTGFGPVTVRQEFQPAQAKLLPSCDEVTLQNNWSSTKDRARNTENMTTHRKSPEAPRCVRLLRGTGTHGRAGPGGALRVKNPPCTHQKQQICHLKDEGRATPAFIHHHGCVHQFICFRVIFNPARLLLCY